MYFYVLQGPYQSDDRRDPNDDLKGTEDRKEKMEKGGKERRVIHESKRKGDVNLSISSNIQDLVLLLVLSLLICYYNTYYCGCTIPKSYYKGCKYWYCLRAAEVW